MKDKVCTLLGFAAKAGALKFGFARSMEAVKSKQAKAVFFAADISEKSRKEVMFFCTKYGIKAYELTGIDIETLSKAIGRKSGVVAVTDDNFKTPIINNLTSDV
ncbi:MAG: ribosomal L7Ae/L30e/S12e/Gadd45 family protein [Clostridia bacterium]|nr:ribosomal L7Ae/L30e/S12e/Gadd45 family protein [Clostridia bacterium]